MLGVYDLLSLLCVERWLTGQRVEALSKQLRPISVPPDSLFGRCSEDRESAYLKNRAVARLTASTDYRRRLYYGPCTGVSFGSRPGVDSITAIPERQDMKTVVRCLLMVAMVSLIPHAYAQCPQNAVCVTSFTISPGEIQGDQAQVATGQVTVRLPPGINQWNLFLVPANGPDFVRCIPPAELAGSRACLVTGASASVLLNGQNTGQTVLAGQVKAYADPLQDPGITTNSCGQHYHVHLQHQWHAQDHQGPP